METTLVNSTAIRPSLSRNQFESANVRRRTVKNQDDEVSYTQIYHIGIIDYLQDWSFPKKMEKLFKSLMWKGSSSGLSAVPPNIYQMRFQEFVISQVLKPALETSQDGTTYKEFKQKFINQL
jgi:hypothetical protein